MKYRFIAEQQQEYPVKPMCRILGLGERIVQLYQSNRQVYGSPRIHAALRAEGEHCGRKRVARLMREQGLSAKPRTHGARASSSRAGFTASF